MAGVGVGEGAEEEWLLLPAHEVAMEAVYVLAGCHGLVLIEDAPVGETMERIALEVYRCQIF
jgi:hypothetical protein